jgi:hypothetical protein
MNMAELKSLMEAITASSFTSLDISENMFFLTFDEQKLKLLFEKIFESQIQTLNLAKTGIVSAGLQVLFYINEHIIKSKLRSINLSYNNLYNLPNAELDLLFLAIKNGNITHVDLSENNFKFLDRQKFEIICIHLRDSSVVSMALKNCNFPPEYAVSLEEIIRQNRVNTKLNENENNNRDVIMADESEDKKTSDVTDPKVKRASDKSVKSMGENGSSGATAPLRIQMDASKPVNKIMLSSDDDHLSPLTAGLTRKKNC